MRSEGRHLSVAMGTAAQRSKVVRGCMQRLVQIRMSGFPPPPSALVVCRSVCVVQSRTEVDLR
jgi:hypothetical protein